MLEPIEQRTKSTKSKAARRRERYRKKQKEVKHVASTAQSSDIEASRSVISVNDDLLHDKDSTTKSTSLSSFMPTIISAAMRLPGNLVKVVPGYFWAYTFWDLLQDGPDIITTDVKIAIGAAASGFMALGYLRNNFEGLRGEHNEELAHLIARLEYLLRSMNLTGEDRPSAEKVEKEVRDITDELREINHTDSGFKKFRDGLVIFLDTIPDQGGAALVCVLLIQYFFKAIDDPWTAICFYGGTAYGAINGIYEASKSVGTTKRQTKKVCDLLDAVDKKHNPEQNKLLEADASEKLPLLRPAANSAERPGRWDLLTSRVEPIWNFMRGVPGSFAAMVPFAFWAQNFLGVMTEEAASAWQSKVILGSITAVVGSFGIWAQQTRNNRGGQKQKLDELIAQLDVLLEKREEGSVDQFVKEIADIKFQLDNIIAKDSSTKQTIDRLKLLVDGFKNSTAACLVVLLCTDFFLSSLASPAWKHWTGIGATGAFGILDAILSKSPVAEVKELEEEAQRLINVLKGTATGNTTPRGNEY